MSANAKGAAVAAATPEESRPQPETDAATNDRSTVQIPDDDTLRAVGRMLVEDVRSAFKAAVDQEGLRLPDARDRAVEAILPRVRALAKGVAALAAPQPVRDPADTDFARAADALVVAHAAFRRAVMARRPQWLRHMLAVDQDDRYQRGWTMARNLRLALAQEVIDQQREAIEELAKEYDDVRDESERVLVQVDEARKERDEYRRIADELRQRLT